MKKILTEDNKIHNFVFSSGSGTVINYGFGSDFLTNYSSGSGSTSQKVTVPTVPVPVPDPQHWFHQLEVEGIIRCSDSPWLPLLHMIRKKDGWVVVFLRQLQMPQPGHHPQPLSPSQNP